MKKFPRIRHHVSSKTGRDRWRNNCLGIRYAWKEARRKRWRNFTLIFEPLSIKRHNSKLKTPQEMRHLAETLLPNVTLKALSIYTGMGVKLPLTLPGDVYTETAKITCCDNMQPTCFKASDWNRTYLWTVCKCLEPLFTLVALRTSGARLALACNAWYSELRMRLIFTFLHGAGHAEHMNFHSAACTRTQFPTEEGRWWLPQTYFTVMHNASRPGIRFKPYRRLRLSTRPGAVASLFWGAEYLGRLQCNTNLSLELSVHRTAHKGYRYVEVQLVN